MLFRKLAKVFNFLCMVTLYNIRWCISFIQALRTVHTPQSWHFLYSLAVNSLAVTVYHRVVKLSLIRIKTLIDVFFCLWRIPKPLHFLFFFFVFFFALLYRKRSTTRCDEKELYNCFLMTPCLNMDTFTVVLYMLVLPLYELGNLCTSLSLVKRKCCRRECRSGSRGFFIS